MIIYEVTATVNADLTAEYEEYMKGRHIPQILETGHFDAAFLLKGGGNRYRMLYRAHGEENFNSYLEKDAAHVRADVAEHFPSGLELSRDVWSIEQAWPEL
ncbi:MAG: DUF4286 family protein [Pyrinomonadaceae bacterium]